MWQATDILINRSSKMNGFERAPEQQGVAVGTCQQPRSTRIQGPTQVMAGRREKARGATGRAEHTAAGARGS